MFLDFKSLIELNNLLVKSADMKKVVYRFKSFLQQKDKMIDPNKRDNYNLLVHKNLLILDLGFTYLNENILRLLYI